MFIVASTLFFVGEDTIKYCTGYTTRRQLGDAKERQFNVNFRPTHEAIKFFNLM